MKKHSNKLNTAMRAVALGGLAIACSACDQKSSDLSAPPGSEALSEADQDAIWFFVLVKSANYAQGPAGELTYLNNHFFAEIFPKAPGLVKGGKLSSVDDPSKSYDIVAKGEGFYFEGGHFKSVPAVDRAYPNGRYGFEIELETGEKISSELDLSGPGGKTDIPDPIRITFKQGGDAAAQTGINSDESLLVEWSDYSNGRDDPNAIVDDMIFVVFQDCHGERVVHTGLPFEVETYLRHHERQMVIEPGVFRPGEKYSMFVEFPHVADSVVVAGVPAFASYATATYADIETAGAPLPDAKSCPVETPPLDTGQTDRMEEVEIQER